MATAADLLTDAFNRVQESAHEVVEGLNEDQLTTRVAPEANTIAWLVWHLTRVMDDHVADVMGRAQLWEGDGWAERFGFGWGDEVTGYGQSAEEVARVRASRDLLAAYHDAVQGMVSGYVAGLADAHLDRIVDERWDPPVTLAVRLVSVVNDATQHVGQAAFVRGIVLKA